MAKTESEWPRVNKVTTESPQKYCCVCRKEIQDGEAYHYIRQRGLYFFHADCFEKELGQHD